jgi:hypothetical protein
MAIYHLWYHTSHNIIQNTMILYSRCFTLRFLDCRNALRLASIVRFRAQLVIMLMGHEQNGSTVLHQQSARAA